MRIIVFLAEVLDECEDLVCGFDPFMWLGIVVVGVDEGHDIGLQLGDRAIHSGLNLFSRQSGRRLFRVRFHCRSLAARPQNLTVEWCR